MVGAVFWFSLLIFVPLQLLRLPLSILGVVTVAYLTGENVDFSLPFDADHQGTLSAFIESEDLTVGEVFFMGTTHPKGPFMVVAEINR